MYRCTDIYIYKLYIYIYIYIIVYLYMFFCYSLPLAACFGIAVRSPASG